MRLEIVDNLLKNSLDSIFDSVVIVNGLARIDYRKLYLTIAYSRVQRLLIESVRLAHTTADKVTLVCPLMKLLGGREEDSHLRLR